MLPACVSVINGRAGWLSRQCIMGADNPWCRSRLGAGSANAERLLLECRSESSEFCCRRGAWWYWFVSQREGASAASFLLFSVSLSLCLIDALSALIILLSVHPDPPLFQMEMKNWDVYVEKRRSCPAFLADFPRTQRENVIHVQWHYNRSAGIKDTPSILFINQYRVPDAGKERELV